MIIKYICNVLYKKLYICKFYRLFFEIVLKKQIIILMLGLAFLITSPLLAMDEEKSRSTVFKKKELVIIKSDKLFSEKSQSYTLSREAILEILKTPTGIFKRDIGLDHEFLVKRNSGDLKSFTLFNNMKGNLNEILKEEKYKNVLFSLEFEPEDGSIGYFIRYKPFLETQRIVQHSRGTLASQVLKM